MSFVSRGLFAVLCAPAIGSTALAAASETIGSATLAQLQTIVDEAAASSGTVGGQVSIIVGDRRADFTFGIANAELNIPMTVDTVTQIGSTTKVFNAALVMALVDEGKLQLDTPVIQYIPDLKLPDRQAQQTITLQQLLSMSAGLDFGPYPPFKGDGALARYIALLSDIPLVYPPGQGFGYSNASSCIAGFAAERVTDVPWDALLQQRIFEPAGLAHAVSLPEDLPYFRVSVGHAPAHDGQPAKVARPWIHSQSDGPAGLTLAISARDLASFGQLFINNGKAANGRRVLSEAAVKMMMTPTTHLPMGAPEWGIGEQWGLGPTRLQWNDVVGWGHGGSTQGGRSQLIWFPEHRAVLAFVLNTPVAFDAFAAKITGEFSQAVFGFSAPKPEVPPSPPLVVEPARFVGIYNRYGTRYEISETAGRLHYKETNLARGEAGTPIIDDELIALGGDRFLVYMPGFTGGIPVAFFGSDARGRATNLVSGLRTSRRVAAEN